MELDHLTLFSQIVQAHNINCLLVDRDFSNLYKADMELRSKLYSNYDYTKLRDAILKHCRRGELLKLKDDFGLILYIFPLPADSLAQMGQALCVIAGPVLEAAPGPGEIQKIMFRKKLPDSLFKNFRYSTAASLCPRSSNPWSPPWSPSRITCLGKPTCCAPTRRPGT